jgi:hypothetical protein
MSQEPQLSEPPRVERLAGAAAGRKARHGAQRHVVVAAVGRFSHDLQLHDSGTVWQNNARASLWSMVFGLRSFLQVVLPT